MTVLRVWRRLGRCGGCAALAAGMAISAVAGAGAAQAQPGTRLGWRSSAVSWGDNFVGQLGNGTHGRQCGARRHQRAEQRHRPGLGPGQLLAGPVPFAYGSGDPLASKSPSRSR
jgi:hypothetical protein